MAIWREELRPFIGRRIKVRCGRCRRVLDELTVLAPATRASGTGPVLTPPGLISVWAKGARLDVARAGHRRERPSLGREDARAYDQAGDVISTERISYICHRRCGARYTLNGLVGLFVSAARASRTEIILGER